MTATGVKRWLVRRPNASFDWQTYELPRDSLVASAALPDGWAEQLWQCAAAAGTMVFVPDMLQHATLNYAADTTGITMVMDIVLPLSPLHEAAQSGAADAVRELLRAGAETGATAANGGTPLHYAAGLGHCDAMDALIDGGASMHARARQGLTPLHLAVAGGHRDAVARLVSLGAPLDALSELGQTPAALAAQLGHEEIARMLSVEA